MKKPVKLILYFFIVFILLSGGCFKREEPTKLEESIKTPEEVFFEYSNSIDNGEFDKVFELSVVDTGRGFKAFDEHEIVSKKLGLTETYGKNGENFKIIDLNIIKKEQLNDRVRLTYRIKYSLNGREDEITEYIDVVKINNTWKVVFP